MRFTPAIILAAVLAAMATPSAHAQSAVDDAVAVLETFGDIADLDGRWIWANMTTVIDPTAPSGDALVRKMEQFCPEDRSPVMAITTDGADGFDIGIIDQPPGMHWHFRRDRSGHYTQSIDLDAFFAAIGHGPDDRRSEEQVAFLERNTGPVTVIRPTADVLLITNRNGFDLYVRCDEG